MKRFYFLINSLEGGGAERVVCNVSAELSKTAEVTVFTLKDSVFYDLPKNVRHISLSPVKSNVVMAMLFPWYAYKFSRILANENFSEGVSFLEIANFVHILAKRNAIISLRIHLSFFRGISGRLYQWLIRLLYPLAGKIVVNSEENRQDLLWYLGISEDRVVTIYNPIDPEWVKERSRESIEEEVTLKIQEKRVFVTVGRLVRFKHHDRIVRAFGELYRQGIRDFHWLIVGDGPEYSRIAQRISDCGLDWNVTLLGSRKNPFPYVSKADFFVYASEIEGFPNVLLESIALGVPVITSEFKSGAREVVFWEYCPGNIPFPAIGPNGVMLGGSTSYGHQFAQFYSQLDAIGKPNGSLKEWSGAGISKKWEELLAMPPY